MITLNIIFASLVLIVAIAMLAFEFKRDLMMMQQNSYRIDRYMRWLRVSADTTTVSRLLAICVFLASLVTFSRPTWALGLTMVYAVGALWWLLSRHYKKPLVWTPRARRIFIVTFLLAVVAIALALIFSAPGAEHKLFVATVTTVGIFCASHCFIVAAVWLLQPLEKAINRRYYNEARDILASMPELKVIGITGSYGKTSTKNYLYHILAESFETLMTPGSYNTTLGVVRTIRELMKPYTEVFICEMGAKAPGDIKEICDLVHPSIGIITAVGPQHLESFKTIDCVCRTKFELVDSLPAAGGLAVINDDFEPSAAREVTSTSCLRYAVNHTDAAAYRAVDITYSPMGTSFTVVGPNGFSLKLKTRLVGECNISNLLGAIIVALHLGVPTDKITHAVEHIEQVEHRLSIKRIPGGYTIIDDAFNSNPTGSAMALDVLAAMTPGKRIVITPGMIELGDRQDELNYQFGQKMTRCCDVVIVVGIYNRDAITRGLSDAGSQPPQILTVDSFADAQKILPTIAQAGDTVLYENDLPDTFK